MDKNTDKTKILQYWRMIEFFMPQKIPTFKPNDKTSPVYQINSFDQVPWDKEHKFNKAALASNYQTRHIVYGGVYAVDKIRESLETVFGQDNNTFDERKDGLTCVFSLQLTEDGRPLFDSFVLSACAWALGRLKKPGPQDKNWLSGFEGDMEKLGNAFEQKFALQGDDEEGVRLENNGFNIGRLISTAELLESVAEIEEELKLEHLNMNVNYIVVKSFVISRNKKNYQVNDNDFLNSFFIKDLAKISKAVTKNEISVPLASYLQESIRTNTRIDIRKNSILDKFSNLIPNEFPRGCWPTKGLFSLAYAQQFAINMTFKKLSQEGLFSVNGPPGTGKTTLLRDLVAGVIVERALKIAELAKPQDAFTGTSNWKTDNSTQEIALWKEDLLGFEMVVCSSNNSAVENITVEIPLINAIDESYIPEVNYFSTIATEILHNTETNNLKCWALLAAKLGRKENRRKFIEKFWARPDKKEKDTVVQEHHSFYQFLTDKTTMLSNWANAVQSFKIALARENELREYRQMLFEKQKNILESENKLSELYEKIRLLELKKVEEEEKIKQLQAACQRYEEQRQTIHERRSQHRQFKPTWLEIIFSLGKIYKPWQEKDSLYQEQMAAIEKTLDELLATIIQHNDPINSLKNEILMLEDAVGEWQKNYESVEQGKAVLGKNFPDLTLLENEEALELSSPWMDEIWFQARSKVFLAALNLHRVFIEHNKKIFLKNLIGAVHLLSGKGQNADCTLAIRSAWASFFFVVPVISTTFASFDRLFSHLKQSALGWLFIDEAGQATSQAAVGALWRSRRAVVVGDPLQLEPILNVPVTAQEALRKYAEVSDLWLPKRISAQILSDRVNEYGTYLPMQDGQSIWIGSPLRVHRRCDNPMFHISNSIAYDGMMVFGTPTRESLGLMHPCWIHVKGDTSVEHWIEAEGLIVQQLLGELMQMIDGSEIVLISPFKSVIDGLNQLNFPVKVGTIHTMQGKESAIVILVLGGNPAKPGAKDWAAEKPNLLNVAVSRAKRRLYVIGDKNTWGTRPYFCELAQLL